jgi:hypothetical protein
MCHGRPTIEEWGVEDVMKTATRKLRKTQNEAEPPQRRRLWTEAQCASYVSKSVHSLRRDRRLGLAPPHVRVGRAIRYVPEIVEEFLLRTLTTKQKE